MNNDPIHVLLIEDDQVCVKMVECYLAKSKRNFEFISADTVQGGIELLNSHRVDVVISDLSLPDSAGMNTVNTVSDHAYGVPLIVLTGNDSTEIQFAAMEAGAQEYLVKGQLSSFSIERTILHAMQRHQYQAKIQTLLSEVEEKNSELETQKQELVKNNLHLRDLYQAAHSFVDSVSHEFRSPLNVVNDYVSLVRDAMVGPVNDEQRQMLDVVSVQVDDLNNMVDDLMDVSRIESRMLKTWRRPCCLNDVAALVTPCLKRKAETRDIQFEIDFDAGLPTVFCDSEKVSRIMVNLVNNAMKLADNYGKVRLWATADADAGLVFVGVDGTGQGIPPEELEEIQQRLSARQVDLRDSSPNFGLGLNIARELVELNLGTMEIHSEVGVGNVFSFCLPVSEPRSIMKQFFNFNSDVSAGVDSNSPIELLTCNVNESTDEGAIQELEMVFQSVVGANDLLIGGDGGTWVLVTGNQSGSENANSDQLMEALQAEQQRQAQRRLSCKLPEFEVKKSGSYAPSDHVMIMTAIEREIGMGKETGENTALDESEAAITEFSVQ